jgi:hypothetical protein
VVILLQVECISHGQASNAGCEGVTRAWSPLPLLPLACHIPHEQHVDSDEELLLADQLLPVRRWL